MTNNWIDSLNNTSDEIDMRPEFQRQLRAQIQAEWALPPTGAKPSRTKTWVVAASLLLVGGLVVALLALGRNNDSAANAPLVALDSTPLADDPTRAPTTQPTLSSEPIIDIVTTSAVPLPDSAPEPESSDAPSSCSPIEQFAEFDQRMELDKSLVRDAEELTASLVGHDEVTSLNEDQALPPDDARKLGIDPVVDAPARAGVPGVRAVLFDTAGKPTVVVAPDVPSPDIAFDVIVSCVGDEDIAAVNDVLSTMKLTGDQFISAGYSPFVDKIEIITNLKDEVVRASLPAGLTDRQFTVQHADASRADRRRDDVYPQ